MTVRMNRGSAKSDILPWLPLALSVFFLLFPLLVFSGDIKDSRGNTISENIVGHAGGGTIVDKQHNRIESLIGQVVVGTSITPSGARLYHGIYAEIEPPVTLITGFLLW